MRPKVKYAVIYRHREEYPVAVMCKIFGVSRSGYYDFVKRLGQAEHDAELARKIEECQNKTDKTYGYRRVWKWLKGQNIERNPKTVLRVMKKYGLLSEIRRRRKWVNLSQQVHKYENLLNRQFCADRPNAKWVTDISYIHTKEGVLYLSMIRDLYDNSIVAYKTATKQTVNRVCPKFCVNSIWGANRAKFIQGGSRGIRLPPFQQHNAGEVGCQGRRSRSSCP